MTRREFLTIVGATLMPRLACAQAGTGATVGFLHSASPEGYSRQVEAWLDGLRTQGFLEGKNLRIEYRWARDDVQRLPGLAAELAARNLDCIVAAGGLLSARAAKTATSKIPVIFTTGEDPVLTGLVPSLNRPGGNITGVTFLTIELGPKRLELLKELLPSARKVALLAHPAYSRQSMDLDGIEQAARKLGIEVQLNTATSEKEIIAAFSAIEVSRPDALLIVSNPLFTARRQQIVNLAATMRLPAMYPLTDYTQDGGLFSYGASSLRAYRETGILTGRVLRGEKPADLPVMQPMNFELVINLKAAKALGLEIPAMLLARATQVLE